MVKLKNFKTTYKKIENIFNLHFYYIFNSQCNVYHAYKVLKTLLLCKYLIKHYNHLLSVLIDNLAL